MANLENPITTQEQLDAVIGERLKREREGIAKKYGDYTDLQTKVADYEKQLAANAKAMKEASEKATGYEKQLAERDAKIKSYETSSVKMRIAHEIGIPYELADRLSGEDENAIRKDAESVAKFLTKQTPPPAKSNDPAPGGKGTSAAYKTLLEGLNNKE